MSDRTWTLFGAFLFTLGLVAVLASSGWARGGLVVVSPADPGCPDNSGDLYVDCGNGTVTDNRTAVIWLKNASCVFGGTSNDWADAMLTAAALHHGSCGLTDNSEPGDWRLATLAEWQAMIADVAAVGACSPFLTNADGTMCWADDMDPFVDVTTTFHWMATLGENLANTANFINMTNGFIAGTEPKTSPGVAWPVRLTQ